MEACRWPCWAQKDSHVVVLGWKKPAKKMLGSRHMPAARADGEGGRLHPRAGQEKHGQCSEGVCCVPLLNTGEAAPVQGFPVQKGC